jgi:phosphoglycerol transferase MdoB-like AlkP superfamily enzyme
MCLHLAAPAEVALPATASTVIRQASAWWYPPALLASVVAGVIGGLAVARAGWQASRRLPALDAMFALLAGAFGLLMGAVFTALMWVSYADYHREVEVYSDRVVWRSFGTEVRTLELSHVRLLRRSLQYSSRSFTRKVDAELADGSLERLPDLSLLAQEELIRQAQSRGIEVR